MMNLIDKQIKLANKFDFKLNKIFLEISKNTNKITKREKFIISYFEKLLGLKYRSSANFLKTHTLGKNTIFTKFKLFIFIILSYFYLSKYLFQLILNSKKTIKSADIIYLQKKSSKTGIEKTYGELKRLSKINNINIDIISLEFESFILNKENTLNSISKFKFKLLHAYKHVFFSIFFDFKILSKINPPIRDLKIFIENLFISKIVSEVETKLFLGSMLDKPIYTLIYMNKHPKKYICSFSDGYTFYPMPRPNHNFCDIFYASCKSELNEFNNFGGFIKKNELVGHVRLFNNDFNGISHLLLSKIKNFQKKILISSTQGFIKNIDKNNNTLFGKGFIAKINLFFKEIYYNAKVSKNYLFIIKEKKNELNLLDTEILSLLKNLKNVHIVRCKHPSDLENNSFIDILKYSDLVISLALNSTTIFETLNKGKPVLIYNYVNFKTPWDNFKNIIYKNSELMEKMNFIFNCDPNIIQSIIKELKIIYNIHDNACENIILNLKNNLIK